MGFFNFITTKSTNDFWLFVKDQLYNIGDYSTVLHYTQSYYGLCITQTIIFSNILLIA